MRGFMTSLVLLLMYLAAKGTSENASIPEPHRVDLEECIDRDGIVREPKEEWFDSFTCENCVCKEGEISCYSVKRPCPPAPDSSCIPVPGGCCSTWDCGNQTCVDANGVSRKLGEIWPDNSDPCKPFICTDTGIRKTIKECPVMSSPPNPSCHLESDGDCCYDWQCKIKCPDPKSFGRACVQFKDQCQNDDECDYGEFCCLVAGCGKECLTPCVDSDGLVHLLGDIWQDPQNPDKKLICREDGIHECVLCPFDEQATTDSEEDLPQESEEVLEDERSSLNLLKDIFPLKDASFYLEALKSGLRRVKTSSSGSGKFAATVDLGGSLGVDVQSFVNKFNFSAVLPLLSQDTAQATSVALDVGMKSLQVRIDNTRLISERRDTLAPDSASIKHQVAFRRTDPISTNMANLGHLISRATDQIVTRFGIPPSATSALTLLGESKDCTQRFKNFLRPDLAPACSDQTTYRNLDGSCNNPKGRFIGSAFTKFRRILPPAYGDGVSTLRKATTGEPLPSPRLISATVNNKRNVESRAHTILHVTFGQFFDHDVTATPIGRGYQGSPIKCCDDLRTQLGVAIKSLDTTKLAVEQAKLLEPALSSVKSVTEIGAVHEMIQDLQETGEMLFGTPSSASPLSPILKGFQTLSKESILPFPRRPINAECAPISIPYNDPFYSRHGQTCMEFVRSAPAASCTFGPREQINQQTAYLDGSAIYGVKQETTDDLRTFRDGLLKAQVTLEGKRLLPASEDRNDGCNVDERFDKGEFCFKAGDGRVNEQLLLTFFQTVWKREHNRIAKILKSFKQKWDDEKLFQETRRIIVAELQHVTYNEFLPTILGPFVMNLLNLNPLTGSEQTTDYDSGLESTIANVFATAAYRFGHSEVSDFIQKINKFGVLKIEELSTLFFNPFSLYEKDTIGNLARGGIAQTSAKVDTYFTEEVAGKLFRGPHPFGLDLVALNIQRGRDHGIPGYTEWRKHCGLGAVRSFRDLSSHIDSDVIRTLQRVYNHVDDIDLFIGGVAERPFAGGIIGPTFTCLVADQFLRIKRGDRFWYEYKDSPGAFTKAQLRQLHKVTLARIFCNNIPELVSVQPKPLRNFGPSNKKVSCYSMAIPSYNLNPWRNRPLSFPHFKTKLNITGVLKNNSN